ncbi:MAG TPA: hypothetical protein PLJ42_00655 [Chitinophagales bacterium]|jgi:ATP-dependent DNA helicase RecG|nr:hypothetical protein [Chitinophagales bacterium]HQW77910.1 hypothetical protein [Chitinophagales bacterium]HRB67619.1 hypothetical protein [Chitinophagales bacterium]HRB68597.1 hypothetical protein [Chitinophagales bacterium]
MSFPIEPYNENANEGLNGGLKILLKLIQKKEGIQGKSISEELLRPIKTIERQIAELVKKQLIERRGSRKAGGYFIIEKKRDG